MHELKSNRVQTIVLLIFSIGILQIFHIEAMFTIKPYSHKPTNSPVSPTIINEPKKSEKKGLLIYLDEQEKNELGPISKNLLIALYQEVCPIIISTSLLYNIFEYRSKDNRTIETLYDNTDGMNECLASKIAFQADKWIIKQINNSLNLLLPVSYLKSLGITNDAVKEYSYSTGDTVSDVELKLGLRVNHMKSIDYESMHRPFLDYVKNTILPVEHVNYFVSSLDTIFCKKAEYNKIDIPEWYIYILGHGLIEHSIAYLSFNDFKQLLQFLDTKIVTQLLMITSCYVAGTNAEIIYGDIKSETHQYYSFPIILDGLNDMSTTGYIYTVNRDADQKIVLNTRADFNLFFQKAKESEGNYSEIVQSISPNTAQIKLPGIEWFSIIDDKIVSINSILTKTRNPKKPLDIVTFFKKDPSTILLYSDSIPFELKINSHNIKNIISMVSSALEKKEAIYTVEKKNWSILARGIGWLKGRIATIFPKMSTLLKSEDPVQVVHRIKKISSTTHDFFKMCRWFVNYDSVPDSKWFFIDEMVDKNKSYSKDVLIIISESKYTTTFPQARDITVCFKDKENVLFELSSLLDNKKKVMPGSDQERYYNERIHIIRNEYPKLSEKAKEAKNEISHDQIKKIKSALMKSIPEKVLESRRQVEEERRARLLTLIE